MTRPAQQGFFSLLKWRSNPTRDESRNVAVLLVDADGDFGGMRYAPLSSISSRLHEQGLLDALLVQLERRFDSDDRPRLETLHELHGSLQHALVVTEPKPVAVDNVDDALKALYRAYVAPRGGGRRVLTKGALLDRVVGALRHQGLDVARGAYLGDFIFDAVIQSRTKKRAVLEVLSFAAPRKDWTPLEKDTGHFLFAVERLDVSPTAVVQRPSDEAGDGAVSSFRRIERWFHEQSVEIRDVAELESPQLLLIK